MNQFATPEQAAALYLEENAFDKKLIDFRFESARQYFSGQSCLELGPGSGHMTRLLEPLFSTLTVVDASETVLQNLPPFSSKVHKVQSFFEDFSPSRTFDTIVMEHVLEHVDNPTQVLTQSKDWAHSDTVFLIGVPNSESIHRLAAVEMGLLSTTSELNQRDLHYGHQRVFSSKSLQSLIEGAGFTISHKAGVFVKPLSNSQINAQWSDETINAFNLISKYFPDNCAELLFVCKVS